MAALSLRFQVAGHQADLDEVITLTRRVADASSPGHPYRPVILSNLRQALWTRFTRAGERADLDGAITVSREIVNISSSAHPDWYDDLSFLGNALVS